MFASSKPALQQCLLKKTQTSGPTEFDQRAQAAQEYGLDPNTPDGRDFILTGNLPHARGGNANLAVSYSLELMTKATRRFSNSARMAKSSNRKCRPG